MDAVIAIVGVVIHAVVLVALAARMRASLLTSIRSELNKLNERESR